MSEKYRRIKTVSSGILRQGVTLVEVLFAIGVVVIGLLGVLTLLPVAASKTQQGIRQDRMNAIGRNAVEQIDIHGMRQQNSWAVFNTTTSTFTGYTPPIRESFCIDPRFIATRAAFGALMPQDGFFPYYVPPVVPPTPAPVLQVRMRRITLRRWPGATLPMTLPQAEQLFVSTDDLQFRLLDDETLDPVQVIGQSGVKRSSRGEISWIATLTPKIDATVIRQDHYIMSIVILANRDQGMVIDSLNERLAEVEFHNRGFAGGGATLRVSNLAEGEDMLDIRRGNWLMLSANTIDPTIPRSPNYVNPIFRWYRVLESDIEARMEEYPVGSGIFVWARDVTLQGPDWDYAEWHLPQGDPNYRPTQATIVQGVIGVYEKTIRLETSSLW